MQAGRGVDKREMEVASDQRSMHVARRGRRARLVGAVLFGIWALYLAATSQFAPAFVIGTIAVLMGASYAARVGDPNVRRGSFLIAGTLFFCAYLMALLLVVGGVRDSGWIALTVTAFGASAGEVMLAFRPTRAREFWTHRLVIAAFIVIGVFFVTVRVTV